ncbi:hypothetical protein [Micavibrio aeruginosavorus]|uniref:hypothetical protein n=1 Tax=Micavibrio aeruginosavorus TaxID=349221 RepID=UPI003F4AF1EA
MLSDKFKQLLDIQEERLSVIRADCAPFAGVHDASQQVHQRIIDDIDQILTLAQTLRTATPETRDEQQRVLELYGQSSKISFELCAYIFSNSHCAGAFRKAALQKHGDIMHVMAREQVTTSVASQLNLLFALIDDWKARNPDEAVQSAEQAKAPGDNVVMLRPEPKP